MIKHKVHLLMMLHHHILNDTVQILDLTVTKKKLPVDTKARLK